MHVGTPGPANPTRNGYGEVPCIVPGGALHNTRPLAKWIHLLEMLPVLLCVFAGTGTHTHSSAHEHLNRAFGSKEGVVTTLQSPPELATAAFLGTMGCTDLQCLAKKAAGVYEDPAVAVRMLSKTVVVTSCNFACNLS